MNAGLWILFIFVLLWAYDYAFRPFPWREQRRWPERWGRRPR
jgi:hypothetical protein